MATAVSSEPTLIASEALSTAAPFYPAATAPGFGSAGCAVAGFVTINSGMRDPGHARRHARRLRAQIEGSEDFSESQIVDAIARTNYNQSIAGQRAAAPPGPALTREGGVFRRLLDGFCYR